MDFKIWLETRVVAHISGASGSGKTTLSKELQQKYPDFIFKDLDDFDNDAVKILKYEKIRKSDFTDKMLLDLAKLRQKLMDNFIAKNKKPIFFVGIHTEGKYTLKIPTKNRFLLDVDAKTSAYNAYKRSQKENPKYRRTLKELPEDEKEAQETIDSLLKIGYKPMSYNSIIEWFKKFNKNSF